MADNGLRGETRMTTQHRHTESTHPNQLSHGKVRVFYGPGHDSPHVGRFRIESSPLIVGADYSLQLPVPDTYADKLAALHEYAHYILCVRGGRDYRARGYQQSDREACEEESLAWALVLRWTRPSPEAERLITGRPGRWLRDYTEHARYSPDPEAVARQWLRAAVEVVDTIYETREWPDSKAKWVEVPE